MTLRLWNNDLYRGFQIGRLGVAWTARRTGWQGWFACYRGFSGLHIRFYRLLIGWRLDPRLSVQWCLAWPKNYKL